jgi:hypothetical protein
MGARCSEVIVLKPNRRISLAGWTPQQTICEIRCHRQRDQEI